MIIPTVGRARNRTHAGERPEGGANDKSGRDILAAAIVAAILALPDAVAVPRSIWLILPDISNGRFRAPRYQSRNDGH